MHVLAQTILQIPRLDAKSARQAVRYYKKMAYHRSVVLEGVRRCAMRNRHYWYETAEELTVETRRSPNVGEILERINVRQAEFAENEFETIARLSDAYRRDCGLETPEKGFPYSRAHEFRRLLETRLTSQVIHSVWDVYLCLLYVQLEGYKSHARSTPELVCTTIEEFLQENSAFRHWLKSFRDKLLHPMSGRTSQDLAEELNRALVSSSMSELSLVFTFQRMIDCHLAAVREGIARVRGREWANAYMGSTPPNTNVMSGDQFAGLDTSGTAPSISILLCVCLVSKVMNLDDSSHSSPMSALPENVRSGLSNMLLRSLLLMSESSGTVDFVKLFKSDNPKTLSLPQISELSRDGIVSRTLQEFNNVLSLNRVAVALLYEPLRIYLRLASSCATNRRISVPQGVPQNKAFSTLRSFRKVVFHVIPGGNNSDLIESRWIKFEETYPPIEILRTLLSFFGYSHLCPLDSVWAFPLRAPKSNSTQCGSRDIAR